MVIANPTRRHRECRDLQLKSIQYERFVRASATDWLQQLFFRYFVWNLAHAYCSQATTSVESQIEMKSINTRRHKECVKTEQRMHWDGWAWVGSENCCHPSTKVKMISRALLVLHRKFHSVFSLDWRRSRRCLAHTRPQQREMLTLIRLISCLARSRSPSHPQHPREVGQVSIFLEN